MAQRLADSALFGPLSPELRSEIARRLQPVRTKAGAVIFTRGEPGDAIYVVGEGRIRLSILSREGRELAFEHATPGAIFGEIAVLDGAPRSADATAIVASRLFKLSRPAFLDLMRQHHELTEAVIAFLCSRLRDVSDQLEDIAFMQVEVRLARHLLRLAEARPAGAGATRIRLGASQTEIGFLIGASRQKTNEALAELEGRGAVRRVGTELECVLAVLREIAAG